METVQVDGVLNYGWKKFTNGTKIHKNIRDN